MEKKEKDIRVKLFRVVDDAAPFVEVDYMDKYAQEHTGLMLLDSGSAGSLLSSEMADEIGMLCKEEDEKNTLFAISEGTMDTDVVRFSFALGGRQFSDTFSVCTQPLPGRVEGMKVIGLLGVSFMQEHRLVIDYSDFTLHTSNVNPGNLRISDCDFFFPMEIGLKHYSVPVISIKQKGKDLVTLVDTGSFENMIAEHTLTENAFKCQRMDGKHFIYDIIDKIEAEEASIRFKIVSLGENRTFEQVKYDLFSVLPYNIFTPREEDCDENGEQLPPIELLIGNYFMAQEGWTLDFGAKIIYKLKAA